MGPGPCRLNRTSLNGHLFDSEPQGGGEEGGGVRDERVN